MVARVIEGTITVLLVGIILSNADGFSKAAQAIGGVYVDAVKALRG